MNEDKDQDRINEEFKQLGVDVNKEHVSNNDNKESKEYSEFEQEQMKLGWNPDGEYGAAEWQRNFSLTKTIKRLGEDNKSLKSTVQEIKSFMERQNNKELANDDREFSKMRAEAIKMGDVELVDKIDKERNNYMSKQQPNQPTAIPEFDAFNEKYKDIVFAQDGDELDMRIYLHQVEQALQNVPLNPKQYADRLEKALLKKYPDYFDKNENDTDTLTQSVESGINSNVKKPLRRKVTINDLSREQKDMFDNFKKYGFPITEEQYIKDLIARGDVK